MNDETLQRMEDCAKAATQGKWQALGIDGGSICDKDGEYIASLCSRSERKNTTSAAHITASNPANVLALIERVRELEAVNEQNAKVAAHQINGLECARMIITKMQESFTDQWYQVFKRPD